MSRIRTAAMVVLALAMLAPEVLLGQQPSSSRSRRIVVLDGREVVDGEVIVRYRSGSDHSVRQRAEQEVESEPSDAIGPNGIRRLRARGKSTRRLLATLRANPDIEWVEPNYVIRANAIPNDPSFASQWALLNTGQTAEGQAGVAGADIRAERAWEMSVGSRRNIVAVLDTGIDLTHPDIVQNLFVAPRQFSVTIGSTVVTCPAGSHGYNALNDNCEPTDEGDHGTHVAGIIGAVGNNNAGIAGVNWIANLMPLKILDASGTGAIDDAVKAIDWVIKVKQALGADGNVRVMNASWGGPTFSQAMEDAILAANSAGILFVASAGASDNRNSDVSPHYPASSTAPNVINVAAVDNTGKLATYSNYGSSTVDLGAPGGAWSTLPGSSYGYQSGTSMAAAYVSGAAALVLARCELSTSALKAAILTRVRPASSLAGITTTGGTLDAESALHVCPANPAPSITAISPAAVGAGVPSFTLTVTGSGFTTSSQVRVDGSPRATTFVSATQLTAAIPASDVASAVNRSISVVNPLPGGGSSSTTTLSVLSSVSMTVNGTSSAQTVAPGAQLTVSIAGGPAHIYDWVTLVPVGSSATTSGGTWFMSGTSTPPATGISSATFAIPAPSTAGTYELRFLASGYWQRLATSAAITVQAPTPTLTVNGSTGALSVAPGSSLTIAIGNGPGHIYDWVTFAPVGSGSTTSAGTWFLSGTSTPPATGRTSATFAIPAPSTPGTYEVRFLASGYYGRLATSGAITVGSGTPPASSTPTLTVNGSTGSLSVAPGASLTIAVANGPGSIYDWVTFAPVGSSASTYAGTWFLSGTSTPPTTALTSATFAIPAPTAAGTYEVRFLASGYFGRLATSGVITVGSGTPPSSATPTLTVNGSTGALSVTPGASLTIVVANGPGSIYDWVTFAPVGSSASTYSGTWFLSGTSTPPTTALTSATFTIPAPSTAGTYEVRFLASGYFGRLATSGVITVGSGTPPSSSTPTLTVNGSTGALSVAPGASLTIAVANGPGSIYDWVTFAPVGSSASTYSGTWFMSGTSTPPATALTSATFSIPAPTTPGTYEVRFLASGYFGRLATSGVITVGSGTPPSSSTPTLTVNGSTGALSVAPGASLTIAVANGPGSIYDWVTFAPVGSSASTYAGTWFLSGTSTPPTTALTSATFTIPAPLTAGTYEVRFLASGYFGRLATSGVITVGSGTPPSSSTPTLTVNGSTGALSVTPGASLTIAVANGPGSIYDWVTFSPVGSSSTTYEGIWFLSGTSTPPTTGRTSATFTVPAPLTAGTYEVRFLASGYFGRLATSGAITVSP